MTFTLQQVKNTLYYKVHTNKTTVVSSFIAIFVLHCIGLALPTPMLLLSVFVSISHDMDSCPNIFGDASKLMAQQREPPAFSLTLEFRLFVLCFLFLFFFPFVAISSGPTTIRCPCGWKGSALGKRGLVTVFCS